MCVRGDELGATAVVLTRPDEVEQAIRSYLGRFPRAAQTLGVERDDRGQAVAGSIEDAARSAIIVRVVPKQKVSASTDHPASWAALAGFYALTLAISWGWTIPLAVTGSVVHRGSGWPTHLPALLAPMIAGMVVTALTKGATGVRDLGERMIRWRVGVLWWFWGLGSPLAYFAAGVVVVRLADGHWPSFSGLDRYSGIPALGLIGVWLAAIVSNGLGEETGWRGFALPQLQRRYSPLVASLVIVPFWASWHAPYFAVLSTYRDFGPMQYVGFVFGLGCGSVVLTWLYNGSGSSILIVAVWHGTFNMFRGGTDATQGTIAAVVSSAIMIQASILIFLELRARRRGTASVLLGRRNRAPHVTAHTGIH